MQATSASPIPNCLSPWRRSVRIEAGSERNFFSVYDEERGYPPYHPTMMVDSRGAYSSRRIAQACEERVDFMAVTAMNQPDFRTIAKFRWRYLKALSVRLGLKLCHAAARLVKLGHVALDGSLSDLQYYDVAPVFGEANILLDHRSSSNRNDTHGVYNNCLILSHTSHLLWKYPRDSENRCRSGFTITARYPLWCKVSRQSLSRSSL